MVYNNLKTALFILGILCRQTDQTLKTVICKVHACKREMLQGILIAVIKGRKPGKSNTSTGLLRIIRKSVTLEPVRLFSLAVVPFFILQFDFRVDFCTKKNCKAAYIKPEQENYNCSKRAIGYIIISKMTDIV